MQATSRLPVLLFFHGSAFFLNNLDTHDGLARRLANAGSSVVISVDYRLAPAHKFPAGLEDCYAAVKVLPLLLPPVALAVHCP